jgi:hypothetical protein
MHPFAIKDAIGMNGHKARIGKLNSPDLEADLDERFEVMEAHLTPEEG